VSSKAKGGRRIPATIATGRCGRRHR
jgi:hypothetical protein